VKGRELAAKKRWLAAEALARVVREITANKFSVPL
jgi:hypothetical protein